MYAPICKRGYACRIFAETNFKPSAHQTERFYDNKETDPHNDGGNRFHRPRSSSPPPAPDRQSRRSRHPHADSPARPFPRAGTLLGRHPRPEKGHQGRSVRRIGAKQRATGGGGSAGNHPARPYALRCPTGRSPQRPCPCADRYGKGGCRPLPGKQSPLPCPLRKSG